MSYLYTRYDISVDDLSLESLSVDDPSVDDLSADCLYVTWRSLVHWIGSSEKTIAILGDRWWPQPVNQEGNKNSRNFLFNIWKQRNERPTVGGVSIRSRNGAPSRKGCVVTGQKAKASNK